MDLNKCERDWTMERIATCACEACVFIYETRAASSAPECSNQLAWYAQQYRERCELARDLQTKKL
jgi:hypothetical protein